jgi:hypothetical protein
LLTPCCIREGRWLPRRRGNLRPPTPRSSATRASMCFVPRGRWSRRGCAPSPPEVNAPNSPDPGRRREEGGRRRQDLRLRGDRRQAGGPQSPSPPSRCSAPHWEGEGRGRRSAGVKKWRPQRPAPNPATARRASLLQADAGEMGRAGGRSRNQQRRAESSRGGRSPVEVGGTSRGRSPSPSRTGEQGRVGGRRWGWRG